MNKILYLLVCLLALSALGCTSNPKDASDDTPPLLEAIASEAKASCEQGASSSNSQAKVFCGCYGKKLEKLTRKDFAEFGGQVNQETLKRVMDKQADACAFELMKKQGRFESFKQQMEVICYLEDQYQYAKNLTPKLFEQIKQRYPQKRTRCDCIAKKANQLDDHLIYQDLMRSSDLHEQSVRAKNLGDTQKAQRLMAASESHKMVRSLMHSCD